MSFEDLVARELLEPVPVDFVAASQWMTDADRHIAAARSIAELDPSGAHSLAYDAARKAAAAAILSLGYRARAVPGSHKALAEAVRSLARDEAERVVLSRLDRLRRDRNRSEYGSRQFGRLEIRTAIADATEMVALLKSLIDS